MVCCRTGHHDLHQIIGGAPRKNDPEAIDAWQRYIGLFEFVLDTSHSRIVGVNCEEWDYGWIAAQFAGYTGRRVLVSHDPLTGVIASWLFPEAAQQIAFLQSIGVN